MTDFTTAITVDRTPIEAFDAINNVRGWWSTGIEGGTTAEGDIFVFRVADIHYSKIQVVQLAPGERVVWRVLENHMSFISDQTEWVGTEIRFDIAARGDQTEVRFTHVGLVPDYECYDACSTAWSSYIGTSLRRLIETGVGDPNQERADGDLHDLAVEVTGGKSGT